MSSKPIFPMFKIAFRRVIKSGFVNFWRNKVVTLASVLALTVTLFVIGGLILAAAFLNTTLATIQEKVDISVSFKLDTAEADISALREALALLPEVADVQYVSRAEELADFRARHQDNTLLIQSLEEVGNPFGARLNIKAVDPSNYEIIAKFLESRNESDQPIIDQISFKKDIVEKLITISRSARKVGAAVSLVLIFMSILVTVNTISLAIYISRDEISVMRLVGASDSYVRGPFLVEGVLAGLIAAGLALVLLYPASVWVKSVTAGVYGGIDLLNYYLANLGQLFIILFVSGFVLGVAASYLAIRKYAAI